MPVEFDALDEAHHRSGALARTQGTCEQPVVAPYGQWANLVLAPVVIYGHAPVLQEQRQGRPALETVLNRFGRG